MSKKRETYAEEAERRWGDTEAYRESARRTATYTGQEWKAIRREELAIYEAFLDLLANGVPGGDPATASVVDRHRRHLSEWFYECTPEIHLGLGRIYVSDDRFSATLNQVGDGLAGYLSAAIESRYSE